MINLYLLMGKLVFPEEKESNELNEMGVASNTPAFIDGHTEPSTRPPC